MNGFAASPANARYCCRARGAPQGAPLFLLHSVAGSWHILYVMRDPALQVIAARVFSRPAILEATRAIGLTDAEVARLLGCTPMQVNDWVKGRRPIPAVKHHALAIFVGGLAGIFDEGDITDTAYSRRARLLQAAIFGWLKLAVEEEGAMSATLATPNPGKLAQQMLARLPSLAA
jgi:hypothetical protein